MSTIHDTRRLFSDRQLLERLGRHFIRRDERERHADIWREWVDAYDGDVDGALGALVALLGDQLLENRRRSA